MGEVVNATPRPFFFRGRDTVPIVQEAGWATVPVCADAENFTPTGIRSAERPARTDSLSRPTLLVVNKSQTNRPARDLFRYIVKSQDMHPDREMRNVWVKLRGNLRAGGHPNFLEEDDSSLYQLWLWQVGGKSWGSCPVAILVFVALHIRLLISKSVFIF